LRKIKNRFTLESNNKDVCLYVEGEYLGSVTIGFTKEIREKLLLGIPPFVVKVRARGWTSGKKLRLPQIVEIK